MFLVFSQFSFNPLSAKVTKMAKHTQTIRRQFAICLLKYSIMNIFHEKEFEFASH